MNSSQNFTAGKCSIVLHIWAIANELAVANCILFLEFDCDHLVYRICKCLIRKILINVKKVKKAQKVH